MHPTVKFSCQDSNRDKNNKCAYYLNKNHHRNLKFVILKFSTDILALLTKCKVLIKIRKPFTASFWTAPKTSTFSTWTGFLAELHAPCVNSMRGGLYFVELASPEKESHHMTGLES